MTPFAGEVDRRYPRVPVGDTAAVTSGKNGGALADRFGFGYDLHRLSKDICFQLHEYGFPGEPACGAYRKEGGTRTGLGALKAAFVFKAQAFQNTVA